MMAYQRLSVLVRGALRLCFVVVNNIYTIPTYVIWMALLSPLRCCTPDLYWRIEGIFFHWLLAMVSLWSWSAGYDIVELGDDIRRCMNVPTLVIANHQSTADVPLLMSCFNAKQNVLPNIMWIMDYVFKFTNFGIVSVLHQDFFIQAGRGKREESLETLRRHIHESFIPHHRHWMVVFPEGGFLRKRREISQRYALKNNLPILENVSLPRTGAMQAIIEEMATPGKGDVVSSSSNRVMMNWILDITIAYPEGKPVDLPTIVFGWREPCKTLMFYRLYHLSEVPREPSEMTAWLYARWVEKEGMLKQYYETGVFPADQNCLDKLPPQEVTQDPLRYAILHIFFMFSSYLHFRMFSYIGSYMYELL